MGGDDQAGMADGAGTGGEGRDPDSAPLVEDDSGSVDGEGIEVLDVYGGPDGDAEADGLESWLDGAMGEVWSIAVECVGDDIDDDGVDAEVAGRGGDPDDAVALAGVIARRYPAAEDSLRGFLYAAGFYIPDFVNEEEWVDPGGRSHGRTRPPDDDEWGTSESDAGDDPEGRSGDGA